MKTLLRVAGHKLGPLKRTVLMWPWVMLPYWQSAPAVAAEADLSHFNPSNIDADSLNQGADWQRPRFNAAPLQYTPEIDATYIQPLYGEASLSGTKFSGAMISSSVVSGAVVSGTMFSVGKAPAIIQSNTIGTSMMTAASTSIDDTPLITTQLTEKDWWGALTEITIELALGEVLYLASEENMKGDFDYEIEGNAGRYFLDRLVTTETWKLDDNKVGMNWGHAYAGALYYQAFRNYNFNFYESLAGNFVASTVWEVFAEYKEVVSVNDQIVTIFGGAVLGESLFQIAEMLESKQGWVPLVFSSMFNPAKTVKGWMGYDSPHRFNRQYAQDKFVIYTGGLYSNKQQAELTTTTALLGLEASVASTQGQYDSLSATPSFVDLQMELGVSNEGLEDWQMASSIFLGGWISETNLVAPSNQDGWFVGPSMGIEYSSLGQDEEEDFYATVNVLGLSAGADWYFSDITLGVRGDIFGDFSMVKPFATKDYRQNGGLFWGTKSVLWEGGYGYALGHTAKLKIEASYKDILLGVKFQSQRWDSIDDKEFNRSSDWNPSVSDLDFKDARDRYEVYVEIPINDSMGISVHHERIDRSGTLNGIDNVAIAHRNDETENRSSLRFEYQY